MNQTKIRTLAPGELPARSPEAPISPALAAFYADCQRVAGELREQQAKATSEGRQKSKRNP